MERKLNHVLESLRHAKTHERGVSLLIGAGCSVTAGIPTAGDAFRRQGKDYQ